MANFIINSITSLFGNRTYSIVLVKELTLEEELSDTKTNQEEVILEFDSIISVSINATSEIVNYKVENGIQITDYKYDNPDVIILRGIISKGSLTNSLISSVTFTESQNNLISRTEQTLNKLKKGIYNLKIQTKYKLYENYTLKDYSRTEDFENFSIYQVDMTFYQIMQNKNDDFNKTKSSFKDTIKSGISKITEFLK